MNGSVSAQFYYDGKNRQIARNINGVVRFNSWDGWDLLEEYSSSLNVATGYLQGATGAIKSWSGASTLYYYQDKLGSTAHVANAIGQLVESYHYDLTGTPSYFNSTSQPINSSTVGVADLYAGERWIPELALYDLRNRFMSPELGRFLQADPIGFQGDPGNLYRYCGNDAVNRTDPMGLLAGFTKYQLDYDPNEKIDATHDGYHVAGVRGSEEKPGDRVHLEVDRSVNTVDRIGNTNRGGDTLVTTTGSDKNNTPTIHQQIDVRYAGQAGPKTREFTRNNEWTHSNDAIASANRLRSDWGGIVGLRGWSAASAVSAMRNGDRSLGQPSLRGSDRAFQNDQWNKWDNNVLLGPNAWRAPNGEIVAPHSPIDRESGNPLKWNE
jgi:RHS repeat-associated protein